MSSIFSGGLSVRPLVASIDPKAAAKHRAQIARLLRDFPWLWTIRSKWDEETHAYVSPITWEQGWLERDNREFVRCYVYVEAEHSQEVRHIVFGGMVPTMYHVFDGLESELILRHVKYVAHEKIDTGVLTVYRTKNFAELYYREWRRRRGA